MTKKTVFKVAELAHVFMNGAAPDGARAGEYAGVVAGGLMLANDRNAHSSALPPAPLPAAAFTPGATAPDGRRVVIIAPAGCPDARYTVTELEKAAPATDVLALTLPAWPDSAPEAWQGAPEHVRNASALRNWETGNAARTGAAMVAGVDVLARVYVDSIAPAARRSILSATDTAGESSAAATVERYAKAAASLLALAWFDPAKRENVRAAFLAECSRWHVSPETGAADLSILRAVAQRDAIEANARTNAPRLRSYFEARAMVRNAPARLALVENQRADKLGEAIAAVLRAGLPFGGAGLENVPVNAAALIAADCASVARVRNMRAALSTVYRGRFLSWSADGLPRGIVEESRRRKNQEDAINGRRHRVADAKKDRDSLNAAPFVVARAVAAADALRAAVWKTADAYAIRAALENLPDVPDVKNGASCQGPIHYAGTLRDLANLAGRVPDFVAAACERAEKAATRHGARPLAPGMARRLEMWRAAPAPLEGGAVVVLLRNVADRWDAIGRAQMRCDETRATLKTARENVDAGRPRAALEHVRRIVDKWETRAAFFADAPESALFDAFGPYGRGIVADVRALESEARAMLETVDDVREWFNGGPAPRGNVGDLMRLSPDGRRVITTRHAEVPAGAVRRALAWLDSQPAGVVSCRFAIGPYTLTGRDESGAVTVGCHRFSAEAVRLIREAIAARGAVNETENAAA